MNQEKKEKKPRKKINVGAVIILIISAVVFIPVGGYGILSTFLSDKNQNSAPVFGSYDGKKITAEMGSDLTQKVNNMVDYYQAMGLSVTSNANYVNSIYKAAYSSCVQELAYIPRVEKTGYKVSEKAIDRAQVQYYLNNGVFDERAYAKKTDTELETERKEIKKSLLLDRYQDDILGTSTVFNGNSVYGVKVSSKETQFISEMGAEKHSFNMAYFDTDDYPEEEVAKFAAENKDEFISYNLSAISFYSKEEAESVLQQIDAKEITFEDAIATLSAKIYTDSVGRVYNSYRYNLVKDTLVNPEDISVIESLPVNSYSNVIETKQVYSSSSAYTIFRTEGDATAADLEDEETLAIVRDYMTAYEIGYIESYYTQLASKFAAEAKASSIEEAAENYDVYTYEVPAMVLNYADSKLLGTTTSLPEIGSVAGEDIFLEKAFALKVGEMSSPLVLSGEGNSKIVVLECTGVQIDEIDPEVTYTDAIYTLDATSTGVALQNDPKFVDSYTTAYVQMFGFSGLY